jgi:hypothetical protein
MRASAPPGAKAPSPLRSAGALHIHDPSPITTSFEMFEMPSPDSHLANSQPEDHVCHANDDVIQHIQMKPRLLVLHSLLAVALCSIAGDASREYAELVHPSPSVAQPATRIPTTYPGARRFGRPALRKTRVAPTGPRPFRFPLVAPGPSEYLHGPENPAHCTQSC